MKELAVKEIHKGTETSKIDLDTFFEQLSTLQQKVRNFNNMEDALKGKTGKAIRSFYNEIHPPLPHFPAAIDGRLQRQTGRHEERRTIL